MNLDALAWTLLHLGWQGAAIAALVALALERATDAERRYAIGCMGLGLFAWAPLATYVLLDQSMVSAPMSLPGAGWAWSQWLVGGWSAGVVALAARQLWAWLYLEDLRNHGIEAPPALLATFERLRCTLGIARCELVLVARGVSPMALGVLRPAVLMPASLLTQLTPAQLEALLAHELAHVRRWDYGVNLLQVVLETPSARCAPMRSPPRRPGSAWCSPAPSPSWRACGSPSSA